MKSWRDDPRSETIFNDNQLKLGTFGTNGGGVAMTKVREAADVSWSKVINAALLADRAGIEALVPFARWRGYVEAKPNHRTGVVFDCYTWAAGQGQTTSLCAVNTGRKKADLRDDEEALAKPKRSRCGEAYPYHRFD